MRYKVWLICNYTWIVRLTNDDEHPRLETEEGATKSRNDEYDLRRSTRNIKGNDMWKGRRWWMKYPWKNVHVLVNMVFNCRSDY